MPPRPHPEVPPHAPTVGNGRYALVRRLGEGGMSGVYRGFDRRLRVWRAIKVLFPQYARRNHIRQRFEAEARTMAVLEHENLVRMYDVEDEGQLPFLVMELVPGGTLHDWMVQHGPMPPQLACRVIREVAFGVGAAHEANIIHRDVKPQNVLITPQGTCKLTDFGIATQQESQLTREGSSLGTIGFMAPEQHTNAGKADARADIYGLGATLWSMLAADLPRDLTHLAAEPELLELVPAPLRPVIRICCAFEPDDRFKNVTSFVRAIEAAAGQLPPDPADTPPLLVDAPNDDADGGPITFPEIQSILESSLAKPPSSAGADSGPKSTAALPYVMPNVQGKATPLREWDREDVEVPSYVDPESMAQAPQRPAPMTAPTPAGVARREETIGLSDPSRRPPPPEPVKLRGGTPTHQKRRERQTNRLLVLIAAALGLGTMVALVVSIVLATGGAAMGRARAATVESRLQIHEALESLSSVIPSLPNEQRGRIEVAYFRYMEQSSEPERITAGLAVLDELERISVGGPITESGVADLRTTLRQLRAVRRHYKSDLESWQRRANGFPGALLITMGMAQPPAEFR